MPTSLDPEPGDDEIECGRCGAHFFYELTRCPKCGVNLYEPEDDSPPGTNQPSRGGILASLDDLIRRVTGRPDPVDELFGASINQAELFNNLLRKVGGDRAAANRLIDFEQQQLPGGNRLGWIEKAIQRWERDNKGTGVG